MNFLAVKVGLKTVVTKAGFFLKRNAPTICTTLGVAGFVGTAVATGTAAVKAKEIMDDRDKKIQGLEEAGAEQKSIKAVKKEASVALVKTFAPPVTLGIASGALVFGGQHMMGRRAAAALASAYEWQKKLHTYRGNVVQQLGSEVDKRLSEGLPLDKADISDKLKEQAQEEKKNEEEGVKVPKRPLQDGKYEWLFSSETCGYLHGCGVWKDDAETNRRTLLMAQNNTAPDMLVSKGYLLINDILINIFGADGTSYGATHGWIIDPKTGEIPTISFGLNDIAENPDLLRFLNGAEPNAWLRFNCDPEPIADKIDALQAKRYYKRRIGDRTQRYAPV